MSASGRPRSSEAFADPSEVTHLRIVLDLSDKDMRHFRGVLRNVRKGANAQDEETVLSSIARLQEEAIAAEPPEFVRVRVERLSLLIDMLEDEEWQLAGDDRSRILNALAYFADPDDIIPDRVPGLGYVDDAIMLELVFRSLRHEIEAYENYCEFRRTGSPSADQLLKRRKALHARMRRRRRSDRDSLKSRQSGSPKIGLW
jgi:uncharacterized membrane protein YkvA (DUF1232 family)